MTLEERGAEIAAAATDRATARATGAIADAFPELAVTRAGGRIEIAGRGLRARVLREARLRWIGGMLR